MQVANVPLTGRRYWWAIMASSIFGVNLGDFVARTLHLGHWQALPGMLLLFVLVLALERRSRQGIEVYYWVAVLIGRTAATNLSDLLTHDYKLDYHQVIPAILPVLLLVVIFGRVIGPVSASRATEVTDTVPIANPMYWLALFVAEVIGTALGDAIPDVLDLSRKAEYAVFAAMLLITFGLRMLRPFQGQAFYWVTILVIAAVGLSVGDAIAHAGRLWLSTLLTGLFFVGILTLWRRERALGVAAA